MAYNKIGFHIGASPNATGYGDYIHALDAAGIPAVCMSVGGEGIGDIVGCWDKGSTVPHVVVVRYMPPPGHPDGNQDVPRYDMTPEAAFVRFWSWTKPLIGNDVRKHKDKIVIKIGNELSQLQSEWLAEFYIIGNEVMQTDPDGPFRLGAFSFASGEPEPSVWRGPKMQEYLRLCADDPISAAVCLHEYSYTNNLQDGYPYKIGRFQELFAACDEAGIKRPYVYIHEWGFEQGSVPADAMAQLPWAAELYAKYPEVEGAGFWSLQSSGDYYDPATGKHISQQVQPLIEPTKQYSLTARFPDPPTIPPPNGGNNMTVWKNAIRHHVEGLDITAVKVACFKSGKVTGADGKVYDADQFLGMAAANEDGFLVLKPETNVISLVEFTDEPSNPNPPPVANPLPQGALFMDVSANNALVDVAKVKAQGVQGIGIRLSNGIRKNTDTTDENGIDKRAWYYMEQARINDMPWLGYHFGNENYDDVEQVQHFLNIANLAIADGYIPEMGLFIDFETPKAPIQGSPTTEPRIQLQLTTLASERPSFILDYGPYTSKAWWDGKVPNAASWVPVLGLKAWVSAWPSDSTLVDGFPPAWWHPFKLLGFDSVYYWQWTSVGGFEVGHSTDSLDLNFVGDTAVVPNKTPTPPPTGATYDTIFMRAEPGIWRVIRRADGSGEDVWELPLDAQNDVRVKNTTQGEWYFYGNGGVWRVLDTSPAPQSDSTERYYVFTEGGQIAPNEAEVGVTYYYPNFVQFKSKDTAAGCPNLAENSGPSTSTFLLKEVIQNYTFPTTGFTVDWLYVTVQTGETQLYAMKDGRRYGWCGGGASQSNNVWSGELSEVYFDRTIPPGEPSRYCG